MTLYKNGREIIHGLKRNTYIKTFELLRLKNPSKCSYGRSGNTTVFTCDQDTYVLRG